MFAFEREETRKIHDKRIEDFAEDFDWKGRACISYLLDRLHAERKCEYLTFILLFRAPCPMLLDRSASKGRKDVALRQQHVHRKIVKCTGVRANLVRVTNGLGLFIGRCSKLMMSLRGE